MSDPLPDFMTPEYLAARVGWSPRRVRKVARGLGACSILGNRMTLSRKDAEAILEANRPCPSNSTDAGKSGTTAAPLPAGSYAALRAQRARKLPSVFAPQKKTGTGKVISMAQRRS